MVQLTIQLELGSAVERKIPPPNPAPPDPPAPRPLSPPRPPMAWLPQSVQLVMPTMPWSEQIAPPWALKPVSAVFVVMREPPGWPLTRLLTKVQLSNINAP